MKKKMWKQIAVAMTCSAVLAGSAMAAEVEAVTEAVAETEAAEVVTEAAVEAATEGTAAQISEELYDFQIQLDGEVYQFPMTFDEFVAYGWEFDGEPEELEMDLEPNQYDLVYFTKGDVECMVFVLNLGLNTQPISAGLVGGISIDNFDWDVNTGSVVLAKEIERGKATLEDIKAAYGNPTDTYEGDLYTSLSYEKDLYQNVELYVYKESGVLEDVEIRNFVVPEGFDAGEVNEEVPEDVTAYQAPAELGSDLMAFNVEFDGALYQLPCPVSELVANGWTIDTDNSAEYIPAKSSDWVAFIKEGYTFDILAYNNADYATIPENCWVEELSAGGYGMETTMSVPGGIKIGTTEDELKAALDGAGMTYELYEGSSYRSYQVGEYSWDGYTFYVYTDEEYEHYPLNTVYQIEAGHEWE